MTAPAVCRCEATAADSWQRRIRLLMFLAAAGFLVATAVVMAVPAAAQAVSEATSEPTLVAQETTTSATTATEQTTASSTTTPSETTSDTSALAEPAGQEGIIPPSAGQAPLNPGWLTNQMDVRVLPEYDLDAVLVIVGFSLPADVALPTTVKFPVPTGAIIAGIGEVSPGGEFQYNYTDSYPSVETVGEWDIATIDVTTYRQLQVDYYYDPGLPEGPGERSFPLLVQMPVDVSTLVLHVQEPARATDFTIQPPLQGAGEAADGFTYYVGSYSAVQSGSTLGQVVSYYKPDGALSIESGPESGSTQFNTTTVLLAAILVVVIIIGGFVIYRLYSNSANANQKKRKPNDKQTPPAAAATNKRERRAAQGAGGSAGKKKGQRTAAPPPEAAPEETPESKDTAPAESSGDRDDEAQADGEATEYCVSCGEELSTKSRFCPNCGEARP